MVQKPNNMITKWPLVNLAIVVAVIVAAIWGTRKLLGA